MFIPTRTGPSTQSPKTMNLLPSGGAPLSSSHRCSLKVIRPAPHLFSSFPNPAHTPKICPKPITLASAEPGVSRPTAATVPPSSIPINKADEDLISLVTPDEVHLEGVIQFQKPDSSASFSKWGRVALLAGGDVLSLLLFSAIGRFSHGFAVIDSETLRTADPFIAGWFLSAYFLGGYGEDARGINGLFKSFIAVTKSWALGIPLGVIIRAATVGHIPPVNFIRVTMGSTALLLIGWRTLFYCILRDDQKKCNDVYKRGSTFELFELLTSLVRRW
ncbi:unnamed protein product [Cuscuta campestris]|uniref:Uncharacterized protein n=1 Tax=Cuscuta campestris TaxID=132261 RepID=A0A484NDA7_9ASTE|nr:unnamed protein product [Cuscuta campestris]